MIALLALIYFTKSISVSSPLKLMFLATKLAKRQGYGASIAEDLKTCRRASYAALWQEQILLSLLAPIIVKSWSQHKTIVTTILSDSIVDQSFQARCLQATWKCDWAYIILFGVTLRTHKEFGLPPQAFCNVSLLFLMSLSLEHWCHHKSLHIHSGSGRWGYS